MDTGVVLAFLIDAYTEEEAPTAKGENEKRLVMKLHPALAPMKAAVLPLSRNEKLVPVAREVTDPLTCGDCSAVICRVCGTPLEIPEELGMG